MGMQKVDIDDIDLEAMADFTGIGVGTLRVRLDPRELAAKLEDAQTVEEVWEVYRWTPRWSAIAKKALAKLEKSVRKRLASATSLDELLALREFAPRGSAIEGEVLMKTESRLLAELESATSLEEVWGVCRSGRGTIVEREALLKMAPFFPKKDATT